MQYLYIFLLSLLASSMVAQVDWLFIDDNEDPEGYSTMTHGVAQDDHIIAAQFTEDDDGVFSALYTLNHSGDLIQRVVENGLGPILFLDQLAPDTLIALRLLFDDEEPRLLQWGTIVDEVYNPIDDLELLVDDLESAKIGGLDQDDYYASFGTFVNQTSINVIMRTDRKLGRIQVDTVTTTFITDLKALPEQDGYLATTADGVMVLDNDFEVTSTELFDWQVASIARQGDSLLVFGRSEEVVNALVYVDGNLTEAGSYSLPYSTSFDDSFGNLASCEDRYWLMALAGMGPQDGLTLVQFDTHLDTISTVDIFLPGGQDIFAYNVSCLDNDVLVYGEVYSLDTDIVSSLVLRVSSDLIVNTTTESIDQNMVTIAGNDVEGQLYVDNLGPEAISVIIYTTNGQLVARQSVTAGRTAISVASLPPGQYYAQVMQGKAWITTQGWFKQ